MFSRNRVAITLLLLTFTVPLLAESVRVPVAFDRWMYPFNATPGTRATGSVFGELESPEFDNRDAQIVFGFDVSQVTPPSVNQRLSAVTLRLTTAADKSFQYDPTFDPLDTYTMSADVDAGRPLELYGVATRGSITGLTLDRSSSDPSQFRESSPFSQSSPGVFTGVRSVFASDYAEGVGRDISNHVKASVEVSPWGIGSTDAVAQGDAVPKNTTFSFDVDLKNSAATDYVHRGLDSGSLFFALSSMHSASLLGALTAPSFYLDAGGQSLGQTAELEFQFSAGALGDFDGSGVLDAADIDSLSAEVRAGANTARFDLTGDAKVNADDRIQWINVLKRTYIGDANLNGEFNSGDFVTVFAAGQYEDTTPANSTWSTGDWNGDGEFGSGDFVEALQAGGYEQGPRAAVSSVPEPMGLGLIAGVVAVFGLNVSRRRWRQSGVELSTTQIVFASRWRKREAETTTVEVVLDAMKLWQNRKCKMQNAK